MKSNEANSIEYELK